MNEYFLDLMSEFSTRHMADRAFSKVQLFVKDNFLLIFCDTFLMGVLCMTDDGFYFFDVFSKNWDSSVFRTKSTDDLLSLVDCFDALYLFYRRVSRIPIVWSLYKHYINLRGGFENEFAAKN